MNADPPPITVVMLTRPGRERWVARATASFNDQTYSDRVLLVCGCSGPGPAAALRHAVTLAKEAGGYLALWDDDDIYHPLRLERQVAASRAAADLPCFLSSAVYHFPASRELFVVDLERRSHPLPTRVIPSTLLCPVERLDAEAHPAAALSGYAGHSPTARFALAVLGRDNAVRPEGEWWWVVKGVPEDGPGYDDHRRHATDAVKGKSVEWLAGRWTLVRHWLEQYRWDTRNSQYVCGPNGTASRFDPTDYWPDELLDPYYGRPVRQIEEQTAHD